MAAEYLMQDGGEPLCDVLRIFIDYRVPSPIAGSAAEGAADTDHFAGGGGEADLFEDR